MEEADGNAKVPQIQTDNLFEEEVFPECFRCCVCLDFLYKPVVLACGHISCFWCIHIAMNGHMESRCAMCRRPYLHFPSICQVLHCLLLKINPAAYKRREKQILEEENKRGVFSPVLPDDLVMDCSRDATTLVASGSEHSGCNGANVREEILPHVCHLQQSGLHIAENMHESSQGHFIFECVSVSDVLCTSCKMLLVQPVVLNCGHVYCKSCLVIPQGPLECQHCGSSHPTGLPSVCLSLDCFIEEQFPVDYLIRKKKIQTEQAEDLQKDQANYFESVNNLGLEVNAGVGCDSCGMYPIIGRWYRCKDCIEKIGFDLCEACYNNCPSSSGRFNQNHNSSHSFVLIQPNRLPGILWRLVSGTDAGLVHENVNGDSGDIQQNDIVQR